MSVSADDLGTTISTKKDLYNALTIKGHFFLMPFRQCSVAFLKQALCKKKRLLKEDEAVCVTLPAFPELSIKNLLAKAKNSSEVMMYLPDPEELSDKTVNKDFLAAIINTVDPDFFPSVIALAEERRRKLLPRGGENQVIKIDSEILDILKSHVRSQHGGRHTRVALGQLKEGSKKRKRPIRRLIVDDIGVDISLDYRDPQVSIH